jgi:hypothetical protein
MVDEKRYYNTNGVQCPSLCLVGGLPLLCVCELVKGHDGECERTPIMRKPSVEQMAQLTWHDDFIEEKKDARKNWKFVTTL